MAKRKRYRRMVGLIFFTSLLAGISLVMACSSTPEEKIKQAEKELKQTVVEENRYPLHGNGANFLYVEGAEWAKAMIVLQEWVDSHPCKEIAAMAGSDSNRNEYKNDGWLVYYRDKENCPLASTK